MKKQSNYLQYKNVLHLNLKKKWFDMIASGEKKEEYREITPYWENRLSPVYADKYGNYPASTIYKTFNIRRDLGGVVYDYIVFRNGYSNNAPELIVECLGISTGSAKPAWSDNWQGDVFIIKLGKILK